MTTYHLVPRLGLRMSGAVPLLHLYGFMDGQGQYYLYTSLLLNGYCGSFSQKESDRGLTLTIHFTPVPRLRMKGIEPPFPTPLRSARIQLYLYIKLWTWEDVVRRLKGNRLICRFCIYSFTLSYLIYVRKWGKCAQQRHMYCKVNCHFTFAPAPPT